MELYVNGKLAQKGQEVTTFRGEKAILTGWKEPHKTSSTGKVYITKIKTGYEGEYYPSVINAKFQ